MHNSINKLTPINLNLYKPEYLAYRLNFPLDSILKISINQTHKVSRFSIPKRSDPSQHREIVAPSRDYKILLKRINKNLLQTAKLPQGICGGIINKKLFDMVKPHCGKESVYVVDLKDFYPSITKGRILKMFLSSGCNSEIATLLAELVTFENKLPQGFPTSTMLSNIIAIKLDFDHLNICRKFDLKRTRWIDDIVFSGRIKNLQKARYFIDKSINKNGFTLNIEKRKFERRNQLPLAVGLTLNKRNPYVPNKIVEHIECIINFAFENGVSATSEIFSEEFRGNNLLKSLEGKIHFIEEFNPEDSVRLKKLLDNVVRVS